MKKLSFLLPVAILLFALFLLLRLRPAPQEAVLLTPGLPTPTAVGYEARENSGGNVTVTAIPLELIPGKPPRFSLTFETHSVDLDFAVPDVAGLTDDVGTVYSNPVWDGSPPGGHHRTGNIAYQQVLAPKAKTTTLSLSDIAGIKKRMFSWEVIRQ